MRKVISPVALFLAVFFILALYFNDPIILRPRCLVGEARACLRLARYKENERNMAEAKRLSKLACGKGVNEACSMLREIKKREDDLANAGKRHKLQCEKGKAESCYILGFKEYNMGNTSKAWVFYGKACDLGKGWGCYYLGGMEKEKRNADAATKYFRRACADKEFPRYIRDGRETFRCSEFGKPEAGERGKEQEK